MAKPCLDFKTANTHGEIFFLTKSCSQPLMESYSELLSLLMLLSKYPPFQSIYETLASKHQDPLQMSRKALGQNCRSQPP